MSLQINYGRKFKVPYYDEYGYPKDRGGGFGSSGK